MIKGYINDAIMYLKARFEHDLVSVYGIGSAFMSNLPNVSDVDIIVVLKKDDDCPINKWGYKQYFEKRKFNGTEVNFLYHLRDAYGNKDEFEKISFADWAWGTRSLKHCSKLLWGTDIRHDLPDPPFSYDGIFLRVAYHLEPNKKTGGNINEETRFSKAIFKFGTFLLAMYYPSLNVFDKEGTLRELERAVREGLIETESLKFYEMALAYRQGTPFKDLDDTLHRFMRLFVRETINGLNVSWNDVKQLLSRGFGVNPNEEIISHIEQQGWK